MEHLFSSFTAATAADWKAQITKDLKGQAFEKLIWPHPDGFEIKPFYTAEDNAENHTPLFTEANWDICEQIKVDDPAKANTRALQALQGGATGLVFYIFQKTDMNVLLKDISVNHIYTQFFINQNALHVLNDLKEMYGKENPYEGKLKCFINMDPLGLLAYHGNWFAHEGDDMAVLKQMKHIPVNASLYQEAGALTHMELALSLLHANEYFNYLGNQKLLTNKTLHFTFSVGSDFFTEIAKFRAFRKLLSLLQESYGTNFPLHLHAQTAQWNKSHLDAYTNMLRTTTEGMSAILGGCNSLCVLPFNETFDEVSVFSARISRNQQHVLKEECYLDKVADVSAGSYYLEQLTDALAEKSWETFKRLEAEGGFIKGLTNNCIQNQIKEQAQALIQAYKEENKILIGVNKFKQALDKEELKNPQKHPNRIPEKEGKTICNPLLPICITDYLVETHA